MTLLSSIMKNYNLLGFTVMLVCLNQFTAFCSDSCFGMLRRSFSSLENTEIVLSSEKL